jgi:hypothetical protein
MAEEQKQVLSKDAVTGFVAGIVLAIAAAAIWLGFFGSEDLASRIQAAAALVIAAVVVFALVAVLSNRLRGSGSLARRRSENFADAAIGEVERAWRTFTAPNGSDALPPADALLWQTVASALIRYRDLRERVTEDDHRAIVSDAAEGVRQRFAALLGTYRDGLTSTYYHSGTIDARAVAVVFDFLTHPRVNATALDSVDLVPIAAALPAHAGSEYAATLQYLAGETARIEGAAGREVPLESSRVALPTSAPAAARS